MTQQEFAYGGFLRRRGHLGVDLYEDKGLGSRFFPDEETQLGVSDGDLSWAPALDVSLSGPFIVAGETEARRGRGDAHTQNLSSAGYLPHRQRPRWRAAAPCRRIRASARRRCPRGAGTNSASHSKSAVGSSVLEVLHAQQTRRFTLAGVRLCSFRDVGMPAGRRLSSVHSRPLPTTATREATSVSLHPRGSSSRSPGTRTGRENGVRMPPPPWSLPPREQRVFVLT